MHSHPRFDLHLLTFVPLMAFGFLYINLLEEEPLLTIGTTVWAASIVAGVSTILTLGTEPTRRTALWAAANFTAYMMAIVTIIVLLPFTPLVKFAMIGDIIDYTLAVMLLFAIVRYRRLMQKTAWVRGEIERIRTKGVDGKEDT